MNVAGQNALIVVKIYKQRKNKMNELIIAINAFWLWCCLVPALFGIAFFIIKVGSRHTASQKTERNIHRHSWQHDHKKSTIDIPPVEPNPPGSRKGHHQPNNWFGIFHDVYVCECGEEKEETHRELY